MTQLARKTDPITSHEAADELVSSGQHTSQKSIVYKALRLYPNLTSAELANAVRLDRYLVARRLPDLKRDGHVEVIRHRKCMMTGKLAQVWRAV